MSMVAIEMGTVISGFISGAIGGAGAVEYRYRRERSYEAQTWYGRTERLAQRILRVDYEDWTGPKPVYARNTCAGVHSALARHLSEAPVSVDESVLKTGERLVSECQLVKMVSEKEAEHDSVEVKSRVSPAVDTAERLEKEAKERRNEIGLLNI